MRREDTFGGNTHTVGGRQGNGTESDIRVTVARLDCLATTGSDPRARDGGHQQGADVLTDGVL